MPELMRHKSTVPCATTNVETCVLPADVNTVWKYIHKLNFKGLMPNVVAFQSSGGGVGSVVKVTFSSFATWEYRITEMSERNFTIAYEVVSTEPVHEASSIVGEISLMRISEDNTTFLRWTTDFSNDTDAQVMED